MKRLETDDRGFSLVEIIIVVTIMSVLIGVVGYGLSLSDGKPADECARKMAAVIQHGRTTTMGKYRNRIHIKNDGGKIMVEEEIVTNVTKDAGGSEIEDKITRSSTVGGRGVVVEYSTDGGTSYTELTDGSEIVLSFDAGSGGLKQTKLADGSNVYYSRFRISRAGTIKYILIETLTGRVIVSNSDTP